MNKNFKLILLYLFCLLFFCNIFQFVCLFLVQVASKPNYYVNQGERIWFLFNYKFDNQLVGKFQLNESGGSNSIFIGRFGLAWNNKQNLDLATNDEDREGFLLSQIEIFESLQD